MRPIRSAGRHRDPPRGMTVRRRGMSTGRSSLRHCPRSWRLRSPRPSPLSCMVRTRSFRCSQSHRWCSGLRCRSRSSQPRRTRPTNSHTASFGKPRPTLAFLAGRAKEKSMQARAGCFVQQGHRCCAPKNQSVRTDARRCHRNILQEPTAWLRSRSRPYRCAIEVDGRRRSSRASRERGQSLPSRRDRARSARGRPLVWQPGQ
jgi:hypothetical protein